ncbi:MAG: hypothetical protein ABSG73_14010 [Candidatus Aminicenantales bacterium]
MTKKKTAKAVEAVRTTVPAGTETKTKTAEAKAKSKEKVDKEAKIQGQVDANAAATAKRPAPGTSSRPCSTGGPSASSSTTPRRGRTGWSA